MKKSQYAEAAQIFQQLAEIESPEQNQYRLQTIDALIKSGAYAKAEKYAASLNPDELLPYQRNKLLLLQAQISLNSGNAEKALKHLQTITPEQLAFDDKSTYYESLAFSYALTGQIDKSINSRIALNHWPSSPEQRYKNNAAILDLLSMQSAAELAQLKTTPGDQLSGWIALSAILKNTDRNSEEFTQEIVAWRQLYPAHPATPEFLDHYLNQGQIALLQPQNIVVMLPESGRYAGYARAIREGLLAAYHNPETDMPKPDIRFYDTQSATPDYLYQQAISEGADMIIGPLIKDNIKLLATTTELTIPVLALNNIPEITAKNLYQFGLSPTDEAEQVATKAAYDGYQRALILIPDSKLGQRVGNHYVSQWQQLGHEVLEVQSYPPKGKDFTQPVKRLLNLDEGEYRYKKIRNLIPSIKYTPRRRQDADVIFVTGTAKTMRLLNPQLQYYRANDLPVYATPQIYDGHPKPNLDIDLDGITFCDAPWLFPEVYPGNLGMDSLQHIWQQFPANQLRLIALGIDAYQIIPHLHTLAETSFPGATGNLQLTPGNRIQRNLICAKFTNGIANVIGYDNHTQSEVTPVNQVDIQE